MFKLIKKYEKIAKSNINTLFVIILLITTVLNLISFKAGHTWGDDFSMYIAQAKSIVEGSIRDLNEKQTILERYSSELHGPFFYPWGFPVMLSPVYMIFGFDILAMKIYVFLFFLSSLVILFILFKDRLDDKNRLILVSFFALNPVFFYFKENVLSDLPFLFLSLFAIYLIKRFIFERKYIVSLSFSYFILGFVIYYAFFIRHQGIVLFPILLFCHLLENKDLLNKLKWKFFKEEFMQLIPYVTITLCFLLNKKLFPENFNSYVTFFLDQNLSITLWNNIAFYTMLPSEFFGSQLVFKILYFITFPFLLFGLIANFRKDCLFVSFVLLNLFILLAFPCTTQGIRYIFPMLPYYVYFFLKGANEIMDRVTKAPCRNIFVCSIVFLIVVFMVSYFLRDINYVRKTFIDKHETLEGPYSNRASEMINFIKNSTGKRDIIAFFKPRALRLYTDRISVVNYHIDEIIKYRIKYVAVYKYDMEEEGRMRFIDDISKSCHFTKIFENGEYAVYKLIVDDGKSTSSSGKSFSVRGTKKS